jgi:CRISPR locus-related DNA-binding protein
MKRILITTIYTSDAIKIAINKISNIDEIIYLVEDPLEEKTKSNSIKELKETFKGIIQVTELKTSLYDVPKIMSDVLKKIDSISKEDEIFIHISEGRKTLAFGLLFAAYMRQERIKGVYYIIREEKKLLTLPLLNLSINESKGAILKEIAKENENLENIMKKLDLSKSMTYQYINELKNEGYITNGEHLKITELGRVMIL